MSTYCPKVIIGRATVSLAGPTQTRCIPIMLHKAKAGEVEPFGEADRQHAAQLKQHLEDWAENFRRQQVRLMPLFPEEMTEQRHRDISKPLLIIADAAGGQWPVAARKALLEPLNAPRPPLPENQLLRLIQRFREEMARGKDYFETLDFLNWVNRQEDRPWPERRLSREKLASVLRPYGIRPEQWRGDRKKIRGYHFASFADAFRRYL